MPIKTVLKNKNLRRKALLTIAIVLLILYIAGGKILKPIAIAQIESLTGANVQIEKINFRVSGKVKIKNLRIAPQKQLEPDNAILTADRADASFSLLSLLKFKPQLKKLKLEDFQINAQYNEDEKAWNLAELKPKLIGSGAGIPKFRFKRGTIKYSQVSGGQVSEIIAAEIISSTFKAKTENGNTTFTLKSDDKKNVVVGQIKTTPEDITIIINAIPQDFAMNLFGSTCDIKKFQMEASGDMSRLNIKKVRLEIGRETIIDVNGTVTNLKDPEFDFGVKIHDIVLSYAPAKNTFAHGSRIFEKFIPMLQVFFDNYNPQGLLDVDVRLSGAVAKIAETKCDGYLGCKDITMQYRLFPYELTGLAGRIDVTQESMTMKDVTAKHQDVDVVMNGYYGGSGKTMDCNVTMASPNMTLDDTLFRALMPWQKQLWSTFSPTGKVSGKLVFIATPPNKRQMNLYADLNGVGITCQYFPYPITNATGKLVVEGNNFSLQNITCKKGNGSITLDGKISDTSSPAPIYDFDITATNVPVDRELITAFPQDKREFFTQFDIDSAAGSAKIKINSVNDPNIKIFYSAKMDITAESISHKILQTPLTNAHLKADLTPLKFEIGVFAADYNNSPITLHGNIWSATTDKPAGYCLYTKAMGIELTPKLVEVAQSEMATKALDDYKFKGPVNLEAMLSKFPRTDCPHLKIIIDCLSNSAFIKQFDIPLRDITGRVTIDANNIQLTNLAATPVLSDTLMPIPRINLSGNITLDNKIIQKTKLKFTGQNIEFSPALKPMIGKLSPLYEKLQPTGRFDFNFDPVVYKTDSENNKSITLDGTTTFKNCTLGKKKTVTSINILLETKAEYQFDKGFKYANFLLNAALIKIKGRPIENLKVPIYYEPNEQTITARNFRADCMGGKIKGKAEFKIDNLKKLTDFSIETAFNNVSAEKFIEPNSIKIVDTGYIDGQLNIQGNIQKPDETIGRFLVRAQNIPTKKQGIIDNISNAIYESSQRKFKFKKISIDSYIKGRTLQIGRFDIIGPSLALRGIGHFDVKENNTNIKFTGFANTNDQDEPGFLGSLTAGLAPAFLEVDMIGPIDELKIVVTPMPILQETIKLLGTKN